MRTYMRHTRKCEREDTRGDGSVQRTRCTCMRVPCERGMLAIARRRREPWVMRMPSSRATRHRRRCIGARLGEQSYVKGDIICDSGIGRQRKKTNGGHRQPLQKCSEICLQLYKAQLMTSQGKDPDSDGRFNNVAQVLLVRLSHTCFMLRGNIRHAHLSHGEALKEGAQVDAEEEAIIAECQT